MHNDSLAKLGYKVVNGKIVSDKPKQNKLIQKAKSTYTVKEFKKANEIKRRVKESIGSYYVNTKGAIPVFKEEKFVIDRSKRFYIFDVVPMGAVRMSRSDKWKTDVNHDDPKKRKRLRVDDYHKFKDAIKWQSEKMNFNLPEAFEIVFFFPMPASWSEKKKLRMNGMPHKNIPDVDNFLKAFMDSFKKTNDKCVWKSPPEKRWAYKGSILVYA